MAKTFTEWDVEQRAQSDARAAARQRMQEEVRAAQLAEARQMQARASAAQAELNGVAERLKLEMKPLYDRRAELLRAMVPMLTELAEVEVKSASYYTAVNQIVDQAAREMQVNPREIVTRIRQQAGLPASHDSLEEVQGLPDIVRVFGRALAAGLINSTGVGHINQRGMVIMK